MSRTDVILFEQFKDSDEMNRNSATIQNPRASPNILRLSQIVRVQRGMPHKLKIEYSCDGKPTTTVTNAASNGAKLPIGITRRDIFSTDGGNGSHKCHIFVDEKVKNDDPILLSFKVTTPFGVDEAKFRIDFYDPTPPSAPQGPLQMQARYIRYVTLTWKPPMDDGGAPLVSYIIESQNNRQTEWSFVAIVSASQTTTDVKWNGQHQRFRVLAVNAYGRSAPLKGDWINPGDEIATALARPHHEVQLIRMGPDFIDIAWTLRRDVSEGDGEQSCTYCIRKNTGYMNRETTVLMQNVKEDGFYRDYGVVPGQKYQYGIARSASTNSSFVTKMTVFVPGQGKIVANANRDERQHYQMPPAQLSHGRTDEAGPSGIRSQYVGPHKRPAENRSNGEPYSKVRRRTSNNKLGSNFHAGAWS